MENNQKSVFERLDSLNDKVDSHDIKLDSMDEKLDQVLKMISESSKKAEANNKTSNNNKPIDEKAVLHEFMHTARKEYLWFGKESDFAKSKKLLILTVFVLMLVLILSTVFTSMAIGFYSPLTLFENIWLIFTIMMANYAINFKKRMTDVDLRNHSCENYQQDRDGTWRIVSPKKTFIWFRRFSNISCIANIIMMWCINQGTSSIVATIFEILVFVITFCSLFSYSHLTCMYGNIILYTNKGKDGKKATVVFDTIAKKLMSYDDFEKKFDKVLN